MSYTSLIFLYFFLPAFMAVYAVAKARHRQVIMALGSCLVIFWASPYGLIPMGILVVLAYFSGIICFNLRERKAGPAAVTAAFLAVAFTQLLLMLVFKQLRQSFVTTVALGVMTLNSASYIIDIKQGELEPETRFFTLWAYIAFLPSLCGIPFVRYKNYRKTFAEPKLRLDYMSEGILLLLIGIAEKIVISDRLTELFNDMQTTSSGTLSSIMSWMGVLAFGGALYLKLKGLSHIAQGFALMLGFKLSYSFDYPYSKPTLKEYIESFNISGYEFLRRYVYKPISKNGSKATALLGASISVLLLCISYKLSVNYLLWGTLAAALLIVEISLEDRLAKIPRAVRYIFTHMFILIGWALISQDSIIGSMEYISRMFTGGMLLDSKPLLYFLGTAMPYFIIILIFELPLFKTLMLRQRKRRISILYAVKPLLILALLILCTSYMMSGTLSLPVR